MPVQNHIHLSTSLGASPENAPTLTFAARKRVPTWQGEAEMERSWTGKLWYNFLADESGDPIIFTSYEYVLRVSETQIDQLVAMLHQQVYFVDHIHPNDGSDHTNYVRQMYLSSVKHVSNFDNMLNTQFVSISLEDADTV